MNPKLLLPLFLAGLLAGPQFINAQGTAFTYQGRLSSNGTAANGSYDLTFGLCTNSTGGTVAAGPVTNANISVSNGLFTTSLNFNNAFAGGVAYWLEIGVRGNGGGAFTILSPRQPITPAPYAITAGNLSGPLPAGQLSGALPPGALSGVYSNAVSLTNQANTFSGNGSGLTNLPIPTGALQAGNNLSDVNDKMNSARQVGVFYLGSDEINPQSAPHYLSQIGVSDSHNIYIADGTTAGSFNHRIPSFPSGINSVGHPCAMPALGLGAQWWFQNGNPARQTIESAPGQFNQLNFFDVNPYDSGSGIALSLATTNFAHAKTSLAWGTNALSTNSDGVKIWMQDDQALNLLEVGDGAPLNLMPGYGLLVGGLVQEPMAIGFNDNPFNNHYGNYSSILFTNRHVYIPQLVDNVFVPNQPGWLNLADFDLFNAHVDFNGLRTLAAYGGGMTIIDANGVVRYRIDNSHNALNDELGLPALSLLAAGADLYPPVTAHSTVKARQYLGTQTVVATSGASQTVDGSLATDYVITLSANCTITVSGLSDTETVTVKVINTASNWTLTWSGVAWPGGVAPTMSPGTHYDIYTIKKMNGVVSGFAAQNY